MTRPFIEMHPGFEDLSAYADRTDLEAARTRVGRHVAKCGRCRTTVSEIAALGEAARGYEPPGAPPGLWERIERQAKVGSGVAASVREAVVDVPVARDGASPSTTGAEPPGVRRLERRAGLAILATLVVGAAVVAVDVRRPLAAATPERMTIEREYVLPGAVVEARYRPIAALGAQPTLTVWAHYETGGAERESRGDDPLVRTAVLRRVSSQEYVGTVGLPRGASVAWLIVGDSAGDVLDREARVVVLAADAPGRPTLDALVTLLGRHPLAGGSPVRERAAAAMKRYYPSRPETWMLTYPFAHGGVIGDVVKLFESRERTYYGWHDRLEGRSDLSAATELTMANLGEELMDTARAVFWADRLVRDHPTNPDAPALWIRRFRDVRADSIPGVLERFEPIWRGAPDAGGTGAALTLAQRSGDARLVDRWRARARAAKPNRWRGVQQGPLPLDEPALAAEEAALRAELAAAERDSLPGPTLWTNARRAAWLNRLARQGIRTRLAAIQLVRGDARGARSALDRLVSEEQEGQLGSCPLPETIRWRAEAARRLGDHDAARNDLAYLATTESWQVAMVGDSAATLLGAAYDSSRWSSAKAAAREQHRRCFAAGRAARAAEQ